MDYKRILPHKLEQRKYYIRCEAIHKRQRNCLENMLTFVVVPLHGWTSPSLKYDHHHSVCKKTACVYGTPKT